MIRAQRAAHRAIWFAIALLATPLLALSLTGRPERPRRADGSLPDPAPESLPATFAPDAARCAPALEPHGVVATWGDGARRLAIAVSPTFALPETLLYAARSDAADDALPLDARLLGVVSAGRARVVTLEPGEDRLLLFCLPRQEIVAQDRLAGIGATR